MRPMKKATQFSLVLANRQGAMAQLAQILAAAEVNMQALALSDGIHTGVVKLVVDKPDAARDALRDAHLQFYEQEVIVVSLDDESGALAKICEKLAEDGLSIDYIYGSGGVPDEGSSRRCQLIMSLSDLTAAEEALNLADAGWPRP